MHHSTTIPTVLILLTAIPYLTGITVSPHHDFKNITMSKKFKSNLNQTERLRRLIPYMSFYIPEQQFPTSPAYTYTNAQQQKTPYYGHQRLQQQQQQDLGRFHHSTSAPSTYLRPAPAGYNQPRIPSQFQTISYNTRHEPYKLYDPLPQHPHQKYPQQNQDSYRQLEEPKYQHEQKYQQDSKYQQELKYQQDQLKYHEPKQNSAKYQSPDPNYHQPEADFVVQEVKYRQPELKYKQEPKYILQEPKYKPEQNIIVSSTIDPLIYSHIKQYSNPTQSPRPLSKVNPHTPFLPSNTVPGPFHPIHNANYDVNLPEEYNLAYRPQYKPQPERVPQYKPQPERFPSHPSPSPTKQPIRYVTYLHPQSINAVTALKDQINSYHEIKPEPPKKISNIKYTVPKNEPPRYKVEKPLLLRPIVVPDKVHDNYDHSYAQTSAPHTQNHQHSDYETPNKLYVYATVASEQQHEHSNQHQPLPQRTTLAPVPALEENAKYTVPLDYRDYNDYAPKQQYVLTTPAPRQHLTETTQVQPPVKLTTAYHPEIPSNHQATEVAVPNDYMEIPPNHKPSPVVPAVYKSSFKGPQYLPKPVSTTAFPKFQSDSLADILKKLQDTNHLPKTLTPDNIDNSIKTLVKILNNLKETQHIAESPPQTYKEEDYDYKDYQDQPSKDEVHDGTPGPNSGRPGVDYPNLHEIPHTSFNCKEQRYKGFFGDPETNCQVWHYCDLNGGQASFLCPNGTIFSQVALTCDWWFNVKCSSTPQLYVLNERLYKYILPFSPKFPEDYSGPLVDKYLAIKFQEMEEKMRREKLKGKQDATTESDDNSKSSQQSSSSTASASSSSTSSSESGDNKSSSDSSDTDEQPDTIEEDYSIDDSEQYTTSSAAPPLPSQSHTDTPHQPSLTQYTTTQASVPTSPYPSTTVGIATTSALIPQHIRTSVETEKVEVIEIQSDGSTGHLIPIHLQH